jgi:hypothetical protein
VWLLFLPAIRAHDQLFELEGIMRAPPVAPAFGYFAFGHSTYFIFSFLHLTRSM